jgi:peptidyl-prolyl cis-trans isomerase D
MFLNYLRRKRDSLKWILWLLIFVLGAGMLLLFVDPPTGATNGLATGEVARVGDEKIPLDEFQRNFGQLADVYRNRFGESFEQYAKQLDLPGQAVNTLIGEYAIARHARSLGLDVTDEEVAEQVMSITSFKDESGNFVGLDLYQQILSRNRFSVNAFENAMRRNILRGKLQTLLVSEQSVSAAAVEREFLKQEQQSRIRYVAFNPEDVTVDITGEGLQAYFEANKESYKLPERRSVRYLEVPIDESVVEVDDAIVSERMKDIPLKEGARVGQLFFGASPEKLELANRVLKQLRKGRSFGELAAQHSEDESAVRGGDLGWILRGTQDPDWEKVVFSLATGELSDVFQTPFGYYIVQVINKPDSLDETRRLTAESQIIREEATKVASQLAGAILEKLKDGANFEKVAKQERLELEEVPLFAVGDVLEKPRVKATFNQQVFEGQEASFLPEPYFSPASFLIVKVVAVIASRIPEMALIKAGLEKDYTASKRIEINQQKADAFYELSRAKGFDKATAGVRSTVTDFFKSGDTVDDLVGLSPRVHERVLFMKPGELSPPISLEGSLVVFEMVEKSEVAEEVFESRKGQIRQILTSSKQSTIFGGYVRNLVEDLRENDQIRINQELLDEFRFD